MENVPVYLCLNENRCIVAFPDVDGHFDYKGFTSTSKVAINWCRELFNHYWDEAESYIHVPPNIQNERRILENGQSTDRSNIVLEGLDDARFDAPAVQDAVDSFDEVMLKGTFNFGTSTVQISRSVNIRGLDDNADIPSTIIYKKGWRFPFTDFSSVFKIDADGSDD